MSRRRAVGVGGAWGHETPRPCTPGRPVVAYWGVSTKCPWFAELGPAFLFFKACAAPKGFAVTPSRKACDYEKGGSREPSGIQQSESTPAKGLHDSWSGRSASRFVAWIVRSSGRSLADARGAGQRP